MQTVNFNDLLAAASEGGSFEPLPIGDYDVVVHSAEAATTSTGKAMIKVVFKVITGPYTDKNIWNNFVISPESPNALGFFFQHMACLGLDRSFFAGVANMPPDQQMHYVASMLPNRQARVSVKHKMYQGSLRMDVDKVMNATPGLVVPQPGVPTAAQAPAAPAAPVAPAAPAPAPAAPAPAPAPMPAPTPVAPAPTPVAPAPAPVAPAPAPVAPAPGPAPAPAPAPVAPAPTPMPAPAPEMPAQPPAPAPVQVDPSQPVAAPTAPPEVPF